MKKNKGFTLIELLAVIVVLAIIALIATPIVMNTIKSSKKGAAEQSGENYIKQVEIAMMEYRTKTGNMVPDGTYQINSEGNLEGEGLTEPLKIEMNGKKPSDGEIVIENGMVKRDESPMVIGNYSVTYNTESGSYVAVESSGSTVAEVLCTATAPTEQNVWNNMGDNLESKIVGIQATADELYNEGTVYSCELGDEVTRTFYVLKEDGNKIKLIMSENLGDDNVAWSSDGSADDGAVTANAALNERTSSWTKLFDENGMVELISYQDIPSSNMWGDESYNWMRTNLGSNGMYWTSTLNHCLETDCYAYFVQYSGDVYGHNNITTTIGIRPVIVLSKDNLSL